MPGLAGVIYSSKKMSFENDINKMIECMLHEKNYLYGKYINKEVCISIGWVSRKGTFSDCMPVWNEARNICLIFSGENFADNAEAAELKARGHEFEAFNATSLVHLYEDKGDDFLEQLNGWFAGLLVDLRRRRTILFNDRIGMKRVYYHESKDAFYFSTEAKSILKIVPELRGLDPRGLGEYLNYGCVLNNKTIFPKIFLLPGGSAWEINGGGSIKKNFYFRINDLENLPQLKMREYYEKLKETFARVIPRYLSGNNPIGMSLTGGLDTRMIMAWAGASPGSLPCYTFGGMYRDNFDVKVARKVAEACGQAHQVIRVDSGFFPVFPGLAEKAVYITDGSLDVSGAAEFYINRIAREIAPVRLTGNYGGEAMRGIVNFRPNPTIRTLINKDWNSYILDANNTYNQSRDGNPISFNIFKQAPFYNGNLLSLDQSQLTLRSPFLDNDIVKLTYQAPPEVASSNELFLRLIADGNPLMRTIRTDRGVGGDSGHLHSMAARLLMEFTFKAEYAYDYGMPQGLVWLDSRIRSLHPERLFLGRHKFCHFRIWYRDELSGYVRDILTDDRTLNRPYWDRKELKNIVIGHLTGIRNFTTEIHKALTVELTHRLLVENS